MSVRPSIRLLTFSAFSISSLITGPIILKFHMLILEMGPHNRSCPDFAISEGFQENFKETHFIRRGSPVAGSLARIVTPNNI